MEKAFQLLNAELRYSLKTVQILIDGTILIDLKIGDELLTADACSCYKIIGIRAYGTSLSDIASGMGARLIVELKSGSLTLEPILHSNVQDDRP